MQLTIALAVITISFLFGAVFGSFLGAKEKELKYDIKEILKEGK